jgi:hypothetical protein
MVPLARFAAFAANSLPLTFFRQDRYLGKLILNIIHNEEVVWSRESRWILSAIKK